jgi:hypothetical protein
VTVDRTIQDVIDEALAAVEDYVVAVQGNLAGEGPYDLETPRTMLVDRLNEIKVKERAGRGDDTRLDDPLEALAIAGYRADHLNRGMTPPDWDFANEPVKRTWRAWAADTAATL